MPLNKALTDIYTRRQIHLEQHKKGSLKDYGRMLRDIRKDIINRVSPMNDRATTLRLRRLLKDTNVSMRKLQAGYKKIWIGQLNDLSKDELAFQVRAFDTVIDHEFTLPAPGQIKEAIYGRPLSIKDIHGGQLLDGFYADAMRSDRLRVTRALRRGFAEGLTTKQIVAELAPVFGVIKRTGEMVVRTGLSHSANMTRQSLYESNRSVIKKLRWTATLDSRTSAICQHLDGQEFDVDKGVRPPVHIGERSFMTPIFIDKLKFLQKGRTRAARIDGKIVRVDADRSYYEVLKNQNKDFVDSAIGRTRSAALRSGKISAERFRQIQFNDSLRPLTLEQMKRLEPAAFGLPVPRAPRVTVPRAPVPRAPRVTVPRAPVSRVLGTGAGEQARFHKASFNKSPDYIKDAIDKYDARFVGVTELSEGSSYSRDLDIINMDPRSGTLAKMSRRGTWRHEYGHFLDHNIGTKTRGVSLNPDFVAAVDKDNAALLKKFSGFSTQKAGSVTARKGRAAADLSIQKRLSRSESGRKITISAKAKTLGLTYDDVSKFVTDNTVYKPGIANDQRMLEVLDGIKNKDVGLFSNILNDKVDVKSTAQIVETLNKGLLSSFSDLVGSGSRNRMLGIRGYGGHSDKYLSTLGKAETEVFAQMTELLGESDPVWTKAVNEFYPTLTKEYIKAIGK